MHKVEKLKEQITAHTVDPFADGDVIRWVSGGRYIYAAVKTPAGWYTTAALKYNTFVPKQLEYEELAEILAKGHVSDVCIATEWTAVQ